MWNTPPPNTPPNTPPTDPRSPVQFPAAPPHADPPMSPPAGPAAPRGLDPPPPPPPPAARADRAPRRRPRAMLAGVALVAALAGGVSGAFVGINVSDDDPATATTNSAGTPVANSTADADNVVKPVLQEVEPSVVTILTQGTASYGPFGRSVRTQAAGTGMIVSEDGLIVTNAHVVEGADTVTVTLSDGTSYEADIVGADSAVDVAVLQISEDVSGLSTVTFSADGAEVGETVIAIGNALALGAEPTVTVGIVSAADRSLDVGDGTTMDDLVQTDAAINSGNSGGPLVDMNGEVVGMNTAVISDAQNIGFAVSAETVVQSINELTA